MEVCLYMPSHRVSLLDQVRSAIRLRHYSIRTEEAYVNVIRRFIIYHQKRHPKEMGVDEVRQYLSHLATEDHVAASTQNVALSALLFLYREVLLIDLPLVEGVERAKRPQRIPVVLTPEEVKRVLARMTGTHHLMASLLYGARLRLMECIRLRVKDLDFDYRQIIVRDGKGERDRRTILPEPIAAPLRHHLARIRLQHEEDVRQDCGRVYLP
jgi:site-specific recombinase XerD